MAIDIEALKAKLSKLQNKGQRGQRKFKPVLWTPERGSYTVRIAPWSDEIMAKLETPPFVERWFYYALGKRMVAAQLGDADPVRELRDALYADRTPENLASAKKLRPKMRVYIPLIVTADADDPDESVKKGDKVTRLWSLNEGTYKDLLAYLVDPEYGDMTDIDTGRDIVVDITDSGKKIEGSDKNFNNISVRPRVATRALDAAERALLSKIPNIDEVAPFTPYEKLEHALRMFVDGGTTGVQIERGHQRRDFNTDVSEPSTKASGHTTPSKGSLEDAFDELLNK
jgi:hypothetical protein